MLKIYSEIFVKIVKIRIT